MTHPQEPCAVTEADDAAALAYYAEPVQDNCQLAYAFARHRLAHTPDPMRAQPGGEGEVLDGTGWVYFNEDTGEEYAPDHPVESGEVPDATRIRRSTAQEDHLYCEVQRLFSASLRPSGQVAGEAGVPAGSSACPICGQDTPHHHSAEVVDAYQNKRSRA